MAHVAVFFMGMAGVLAGHSGFTPWRCTFYRVSLGALVLFSVWFIRRNRDTLPLKIIGFSLILGALLGFHWFAFFMSINLLGVTLGSALIGVEPIIVALFALLFLREKLSGKILMAMGISTVGFGLLLWVSDTNDAAIVTGCLWAVGSYILFALLVIANRKLVSCHSPMLVTALEMLGAVPVSAWFCREPLFPGNLQNWFFALGLGLLCTGLAYYLFNTSMKKLPAHLAGALLSLEVAYGMAAGWILGDHLGALQVVAAFLIANILFLDLWSAVKFLFRRKEIQR